MSKPISKMDPTDKAKWVAALRSGEFKQGQGALRQDVFSHGQGTTVGQTYCCLGVAQCVLGGQQPKKNASVLRANRFGLSTKLQEALAEANDGGAGARHAFNDLGLPTPRLNKDGKATFTSIANWIEKYL
jgi:hypothetical protein